MSTGTEITEITETGTAGAAAGEGEAAGGAGEAAGGAGEAAGGAGEAAGAAGGEGEAAGGAGEAAGAAGGAGEPAGAAGEPAGAAGAAGAASDDPDILRDQWLTPRDLSDRLKISTRTLARWVKKNGFPQPVRLVGQLRWTSSQINLYLKNALQNTNEQQPVISACQLETVRHLKPDETTTLLGNNRPQNGGSQNDNPQTCGSQNGGSQNDNPQNDNHQQPTDDSQPLSLASRAIRQLRVLQNTTGDEQT